MVKDWLFRARVREAAAHRRQYAARKAAGLCGPCGGKRDDPRFALCGQCRESHRESKNRKKERAA